MVRGRERDEREAAAAEATRKRVLRSMRIWGRAAEKHELKGETGAAESFFDLIEALREEFPQHAGELATAERAGRLLARKRLRAQQAKAKAKRV